MAKRATRESYGEALMLCGENENVVVLDADLSKSTKTEVFKKKYPEQRVALDIPSDVVIIPMDAILVEQVIINILENAIHHAEGFTKLSLQVFTIDNKAIFEITDNGCGIPSEKLDRIFMGYNDKAENASDTRARNAGIGLSVCATIVKAHGGDITAENAKGGGAVFRFSLTTEDASDEQK